MRWLLVAAVMAAAPALRAQDSTVSNGVRVGITYTPGTRQSLTVLPVAPVIALDSVRAILQRDLDYSDRFDVMVPPATVAAPGDAPNYAALNALGTDLAVAVVPSSGAAGGPVEIQLHDVRAGSIRNRMTVALPAGAEALRQAVHRAADEVVRWATGSPGIAATEILFVADGKLWRVDPDGGGRAGIPSAGRPALSPAWSRDGRSVAYTAFVPSGRPLVIQDLASGARDIVPGTEYGVNITPEFSPDGKTLAYAHGDENGTDIYLYDVARRCCVSRLTVGRFYDNLSPTWSPDGGRIAFISTRAGLPQLYVMSADGSNQEALAHFDFGSTGQTNGPEWSPDGQSVVFHREVHGVPQIFILDLATRAVRQITGEGRNEDATWAPDGRHLAFVSSRGGTRQLWIVDMETGRMRPVVNTDGARLPAWSPRRTFFSEAG